MIFLKLSQILSAVQKLGVTAEASTDAEINGISFDSRRCKKGDIFFCKGTKFLPQYAELAVKAGASALVVEKGSKYTDTIALSHPQTPIVYTNDIKKAMALFSSDFYGDPLKNIMTVAVTGTKGKTTTCKMICDIINRDPAFRGALLNELLPSDAPHLTTPEAPDLMYAAEKCSTSGFTHLICEISSQAVKEDRIFGMSFDIGCFLNFGNDHISPTEHSSQEEYFNYKRKLFLNCGCVVCNSDCEKSIEIIKAIMDNDLACATQTRIFTFGFSNPSDFQGSDLTNTPEGCKFKLDNNGKELDICLTSGGKINAENALCAASVGRLLGVSDNDIVRALLVSRVAGRMEHLRSSDGCLDIIIDYAHNKMSFEAVFSHARSLGKAMTVVFGCPGNKAKCRRTELPEVALKHADRMIITDDDSGSEGFDAICSEMLQNIKTLLSSLPELRKRAILSKLSVIRSRRAAIENAINTVSENSEERTVLILGKGDERFISEKNGSELYEGDLTVAQKLLDRYNKKREIELILKAPEKFDKKLTVSVNDIDSAEALIFCFPFLSQNADLSVVCNSNTASVLRELCYRTGHAAHIKEITEKHIPHHTNGICFYIAPENEDIYRIAAKLAVKSGSESLAYIVPARGIMLDGVSYVRRLSLKNAELIENVTETPLLSDMIYAVENGVERCAVLDGRNKMSLTRMISSLEFDGSELIHTI